MWKYLSQPPQKKLWLNLTTGLSLLLVIKTSLEDKGFKLRNQRLALLNANFKCKTRFKMELVEINIVQILLISLLSSTIIFSCYLFYASRSAHYLIPIIKSKEKRCLNMQYQKLNRFREELCTRNNGQSKTHHYTLEKYNNRKLIRKEKLRKNPLILASLDKTRNLPFVSIIVPARNEEQYIERCVRSF